ncbi:MAG: HEAT repeat domain-containing protein [Candidatus Heimdallarchaeota archaeon]|nr:MAG: hypothetical protein DRP02_12910 [Candidatus Gerdarchaeota archaeon]
MDQTLENDLQNLKTVIADEKEAHKFLVEEFILTRRASSGQLAWKLVSDPELDAQSLAILNAQILPFVPDKDYLPLLLKLYEHPNASFRLRHFIIQKIGWRGQYAKSAIPKLLEIFEGPFFRTDAAISLLEIGYNEVDKIIPVLIESLEREKNYLIRMNVARQLVKHVDKIDTIVPAFIKAMKKDPDFRVRQKIIHYCGEYNIQEALKTIEQLQTSDQHPLVRSVALRVCEKLKQTK